VCVCVASLSGNKSDLVGTLFHTFFDILNTAIISVNARTIFLTILTGRSIAGEFLFVLANFEIRPKIE